MIDFANIKNWAEVLQCVVTTCGIVTAGVWAYVMFVKQRQKLPRAQVHHCIQDWPLEDGSALVHIVAEVTNVGRVLLSIISAETRIHQVIPAPRALTTNEISGDATSTEPATEIEWPLIDDKKATWKPGDFEIEPDESDCIHYDFIIPPGIRTVEVYTFIRNQKKRDREIGWNLTTLHNLKGTAGHGDIRQYNAKRSHKNSEGKVVG